jgi:hypothetical protein
MLQQYRKPKVYRLSKGAHFKVRFVQAFMPEDGSVMLLEVYGTERHYVLLLDDTVLVDALIEAEPSPRGYTFSSVEFQGLDRFEVYDETTSPSAPRYNLEKTYKQLVKNGTIPTQTL